MGVGLVRFLQPPDILWIHWRVYNSIANTSKGGTLLPPSDAYVRSFLCLLYTLIKLYYTKALSDPASSLAPDWIHLLRRPRIPRLIVQQQPFSVHLFHCCRMFHCMNIPQFTFPFYYWCSLGCFQILVITNNAINITLLLPDVSMHTFLRNIFRINR